MKPATLDLTVYKGSTFVQAVQWKTGATPTPVDLTGCSIRMQIRERVTTATTIDDLTTQNSRIVITDAVQGKFEIRIPANTSSAYTVNSGVYDVEVVMTDGSPYRILEGSVSFSPEVTR